MASVSPAMDPQARGGWLYSPAVDLLCGYGLGYVLTIPLLLVLAEATGLSGWPTALALPLALALSTPHYGATLLRVYEQRRDRQRYAFFAVYFSIFIAFAFGAGLSSAQVGSWLLTLYVTWSPWHFAGQNYGLSLMSLRRRQVEITPRFKRLLYLSFVLSFALAFVSIHLEASSAVYAQLSQDASATYRTLRLGIPRSAALVVAPLLAIAYLASLAGAALCLRGRATLRDVGPSAALVLTQALWFALPALATSFGSSALRSLPFMAVWISAAHSLQYLWVTAYYARRSQPSTRTLPFFAKAMLAGCALSIFPLLVLVPGLWGPALPSHAGVGVLVFSVVNLHHFVLDGAIWKLRDGRVARVLLRTDAGEEPSGPDAGERHWLRPLVWAAGCAGLVFPALVALQFALATSQDLSRAEGAARRLRFFGFESPLVLAHLGWLYEREGRIGAAIASYRRVSELDVDNPRSDARLAWLLVKHRSESPARRKEALARAKRASIRLEHRDAATLHTLLLAFAADGDPANARRTGERALALARENGNRRLEATIRRDLAALPAESAKLVR